jgi:hypothetical protein
MPSLMMRLAPQKLGRKRWRNSRGYCKTTGISSASWRRLSPSNRTVEAESLSALIERSSIPEIMIWARLDFKRLNKRIRAQRDELAKPEARQGAPVTASPSRSVTCVT